MAKGALGGEPRSIQIVAYIEPSLYDIMRKVTSQEGVSAYLRRLAIKDMIDRMELTRDKLNEIQLGAQD